MWHVILFCIFIGRSYAEVLQTKQLTSDDTSTRIIGGSATAIERYPYTVQVLYNSQLSCGGSLLTRRHVLSAAHCFVAQDNVIVSPVYFSVRVGSTYLNSGGTVHRVSEIAVHASYNVPLRDNDVAVLVMASAATLSSSVALAFVPVQGAVVPDNATVVHVGWGRTTTMGEATASEVLNEVAIRTVNRSVCAARYRYLESVVGETFPVTGNMICAGLLDVGGKDACQGDSGGPLVYRGVVVGVTSWGWGCAQPLFPGVSARVASYTSWINATVSGVAYTKINNGADSHGSVLFLYSFIFTLVQALRR